MAVSVEGCCGVVFCGARSAVEASWMLVWLKYHEGAVKMTCVASFLRKDTDLKVVISLAVVHPQDLCPCFWFHTDAVLDDEFDRDGFDELIDSWWYVVFGLKVEMCLA